MRSVGNPVLDAEETLDRVLQRLDGKPTDVILVRLNPSGWSSVARHELEIMVREGKGDLTLGSALATRQIPYLHPDQPLEIALRYMDRWPLIPVVSRADFRTLEGVISQRDVLRRYGTSG